MHADIAIVIVAYDRPALLSRLLASVARADYTGYQDIRLIISVDFSGNEKCQKIAEEFQWEFGEKKLILHAQNLGLKKHVLLCGALTSAHEGIILLEDDLIVAPPFYDYAVQSYHFFKTCEQVAGIALYSYNFNETGLCSFEPIHDGFDNYFMQIPCSWGQLWTSSQWQQFEDYLLKKTDSRSDAALPLNVKEWPDHSSWKKLKYKYLLDTDKYYVYPRFGLTTNFSDVGNHINQPVNVFQCSLLHRKKKYSFSLFDDSLSIYDAFFELHGNVFNRITRSELSVSFDLNGSKELRNINSEWLISSRECSAPRQRYDISLYPCENNVLYQLSAAPAATEYVSLGKTTAFGNKQTFTRFAGDIRKIFISEDNLRQRLSNMIVAPTLPNYDFITFLRRVKRRLQRSENGI